MVRSHLGIYTRSEEENRTKRKRKKKRRKQSMGECLEDAKDWSQKPYS